jgi:hypothetical protein
MTPTQIVGQIDLISFIAYHLGNSGKLPMASLAVNYEEIATKRANIANMYMNPITYCL